MQNDKMVNYTCLSCGHKFDIEYTSWKPTTTCQKCKKTARMTSTLASKRKVNLFFKKYKDVTAFGYDEHGKEVAIDTKGNRIEPSETRYKPEDEHGWQATGHKVKGKQKK